MKLAQHRMAWRTMLSRGLMFAAVWWVLSDGSPQSWVFGLPAVLVATTISVVAVAPTQLRWLPLLGFLTFFIKRSLLGAVDVSLRAMRPSLPLAPTLAEYYLRLPACGARTLLLNVISLLPGTLSADIQGDCLLVHVLDASTDFRTDLMEVEQAVARLYGINNIANRGAGYETV